MVEGTTEPRLRWPREPLPPEVVRLGWISFLLDFAAETTYPLIPLFLATLGAGGLVLGAVEGSAEAVLAVVTALAGWHSDRLRRRVPYIRLGYAVAAAAKPLIALAWSWPVVLVLRTLDRFGKGVRTAPRDALIADISGRGQRGSVFGFHRAMDTAGALCGSLAAVALLLWLPGRYREIFALTALPGLAAVALTFTIRERKRDRGVARLAQDPELRTPTFFGAWRLLPVGWWRAAGLLWLFAIGNSSEMFLLLRARHLGFGDVAVAGAYALFNLAYAVVSWPAGSWSDRVGRRRLIGAGWLIYGVVYAGFAVLEPGWIWLMLPVYGCYMGLTQGVARAWMVDFAPPALRGTALGVYFFGIGASMLAASLIAGWLWDYVSPSAPFAFGSVVAFVALCLLPFVGRPAAEAK
jgi:MFS family permease